MLLLPFSFQEQDFLAKQKEDLELAMKNITAQNKKEICDKERECLNKKQQLMRGGWQRLRRKKANAVRMASSTAGSSHTTAAVAELQAGRVGFRRNSPARSCLNV